MNPPVGNQGAGDVVAAPHPVTTTTTVASLYVGDLAPSVIESNLFEKFSDYGKILSIRVCRDVNTRRSLGYAYVNFQNNDDAERAMDALNFVAFNGKAIRIMWSQRDPALRKSGVGNIFIKNLDATIKTKDIFDTFSTFGNILSCKVALNAQGESKGFGFVHFENETAAEKAIAKVNGMMLCDRKLFVGKFIPRRERLRLFTQPPKIFTDIYTKNLPESFDEVKLRSLFDVYGEVTNVKVCRDKFGKSRCFGFVSYTIPENAEIACLELSGKVFEGKEIFVGRAQKKAERILKFQGVNVYVKNLDEFTTDETLKLDFQSFGEITSAKVMCTEDGRSRGFGFVCFTTPSEATSAIACMNGKLRNGKLLYAALAQRKEDRVELLSHHFVNRSNEYEVEAVVPAVQQVGQVLGSSNYYQTAPQQVQTPHAYYGYPQSPMNGGQVAHRGRVNPMRTTYPGMSQQNYRMPNRSNSVPYQGHRPNFVGNSHRAYRGGLSQYNMPYARQAMHMPRPPMGMAPSSASSGSGYMSPSPASGSASSTAIYTPPTTFMAPMGYTPECTPVTPSGSATTLTTVSQSAMDEKQSLGERIFPMVQEKNSLLAGKISGMLLEMENNEILKMIENRELLDSRIEEAMATLRMATANDGTILNHAP